MEKEFVAVLDCAATITQIAPPTVWCVTLKSLMLVFWIALQIKEMTIVFVQPALTAQMGFAGKIFAMGRVAVVKMTIV